jgi:hypothetical protein
VAGCNLACAGKQCGNDGCGGVCGTCSFNQTCLDGQCKAACTPTCTGKLCGPDGCGGLCGTCGPGQACTDLGICCMPACGGRQCGSDGCGGVCGQCPVATFCDEAKGVCLGGDQGDVVAEGDGVVTGTCPPGYVMLYGSCQPGEPTDSAGGDASDGCAAGPDVHGSTSACLLLLAGALALAAARRRRT